MSFRKVTADDLLWAGSRHRLRAAARSLAAHHFTGDLPPISDLGISNNFTADDPLLLVELREALPPILGERGRMLGRMETRR